MKIGLYGGTFDPIHNGHIHAAKQVLEGRGLDKITFIPSARPPHKKDNAITSFEKRMEMLQLAVAEQTQFEISDFELHQPGQSFTINTVKHFLDSNPSDSFFLVMGNDMAYSFSTWKAWEELLKLITPIILIRKEVPITIDPNLPTWAQRIMQQGCLEVETLPISSTLIRNRASANQDISDLVNSNVNNYIKEQMLYVQNIVQ